MALVDALGDITAVLRDADPSDKAEVYQQLDVRPNYHPETANGARCNRFQRVPAQERRLAGRERRVAPQRKVSGRTPESRRSSGGLEDGPSADPVGWPSAVACTRSARASAATTATFRAKPFTRDISRRDACDTPRSSRWSGRSGVRPCTSAMVISPGARPNGHCPYNISSGCGPVGGGNAVSSAVMSSSVRCRSRASAFSRVCSELDDRGMAATISCLSTQASAT